MGAEGIATKPLAAYILPAMLTSPITGCLDEDTVLAFVTGSLTAETLVQVESHLAACRDCSWLVTAAVLVREEDLLRPARVPRDSPPPPPPTPAAGRFEALELIAEGAMGSVFRGIDRETGAVVALKRLRRAVVAERPEVVTRFVRESEILRRLDHPNIVRIIASFDSDDDHQIVMEYMPGGSLRSVLRAERRLSPQRTVRLLLELTDALARAHHLEITHRDIKPENVLLAGDGTPRLSDFGLSRLADQELSSNAALIGTLPYLSPEALSGVALDARVDLWALGVMMFEMLAGERPFRGDIPAAVIRSILQQPVPDLLAVCPEAPPTLVEICHRLLERDPAQRLDSARHLGALLESVQRHSLAPESGRERAPSTIARSSIAPWHASTDSAQRLLELASLPRTMTPFIGRARELGSVLRLLDDRNNQLVTLTGPGGIGKSRVALEVARRLSRGDESVSSSRRLRLRVCFVDLTSIADPELIVSVIGSALGFAFPSGAGDARDQLCAYLREKELLLLLDNFEHVLPAAAFVDTLLRRAPGVRVLATSREPLRLSGELQFALTGMALDDAGASESSPESSAVELFVSSARRVRADFDPSLDAEAVLEICRAVQGMPLGILLASSWVAVLGPGDIAAEIRQSPDFLRDERGDLPSRQRSMRAVFDHSWALLEPADRESFARLSVFRGGFTRSAAEAVADARLSNLATLVAKSLLEWQPGSSRYVIHELLRQYAEAKLEALPSRELTHQRLGRYFAQFLTEREVQLQGLRQRRVMQEISAELGNIRSAWHGLLERQELDQVASALWALCVYHRRRGARAEVELACAEVARAFLPESGAALLSAAGAAPPSDGSAASLGARRLTGMALAVQALHGKDQGKRAHARTLMERSLRVLEGTGDCRERALASIVAGWVMNDVWPAERCIESAERALLFYRSWGNNWSLAEAVAFTAQVHLETSGDPRQAEALLRENLELQRSLNDGHIAMPTSLCLLGLVRGRQGAWQEGLGLILQGLEVGEQLNDVWAIEGALRLAARASVNLGDLQGAARYARRCMKVCRETGALESVAWCKFTLAEIAKQAGQLDEAARLYAEARALSPPDTPQLANATMNLGDIALLRGQHREARRHFEDALASFQARRVEWGAINALENLGHLNCAEQRLSDARSCFEQALTLARGSHRLPLVVNSLVGLACVQHLEGALERALELFSATARHPALHHQTRIRYIDPALGQLQTQLSGTLYDAARQRGERLDLDGALQLALSPPDTTEPCPLSSTPSVVVPS
ncbi:MAG: hypothetical protein RL685_1051 [Pseudomonadota bacterium]